MSAPSNRPVSVPPQRASFPRRLLRLASARFGDARCLDAASGLAFTTLLSVVPLLALGIAIATRFPAFETVQAKWSRFVEANLVPEAAERLVSVYLAGFAGKAAQVSALGLVVLLVTALLLVLAVESAFDDLWQQPRRRLRLRWLALRGLAVSLGPLLAGAGLWLVSLLGSLYPGGLGWLDRLVPFAGALLPWLFTLAGLALLYATVAPVRVEVPDAMAGGVCAALLLELGRHALAFYVAHIGGYEAVYGVFATVPIFLVWIYLSWLAVLAGAAMVAVMPQARASGDTVPDQRGRGE
ncbi:MAG: YihY family inner membrane protein [Pseudomonadota bacterium]|jgi:membrane protein